MDFLSLFVVSSSLTFDTLAVSILTGLVISNIRFWQATKLAVVMAFFQGLMPFIGWFIGNSIKYYIVDFDHWIAFILLSILGIKIIIDAQKKDENKKDFNPFKTAVLIGISIATSIDALIVGVSFGLIKVNITLAVLLIGSLTYIVAMLGMLFGKKASFHLGNRMEILGGIILIGLGIKILLEHTLIS
ncbi:MAG: manganese efflux pump [Marinilabiliaceae bacterium]|nr:manganese efflux pump [Marinilabiliaceae bacterium]